MSADVHRGFGELHVIALHVLQLLVGCLAMSVVVV